MTRRAVALAALGVALCPSASWAESLHLRDGTVVKAKVVREDDDSVVVDWLGVEVTYWRDQIDRIEPDAAGAPAAPSIETQAAGVAQVSEPGSAEQQLIVEMLRACGVEEQLRDHLSAAGTRLSPEQEAKLAALSPDERDELAAITRRTLRFEPVFDEVLRVFAQRFDRARVQAIIDWHATPIAQRILRAERTKPIAEAIDRLAAAWELAPPTQERLALIEELERAAHVTDQSLSLVMQIGQALGRSFETAGLAPPGRASAQVAAGIEAARAKQEPQMREQILASMLVLYDPLTDDEVRHYIAFYGSEDGRWLSGVIEQAYGQAFGAASERMAREVLDMVNRRKAAATRGVNATTR